MGLNDRNYMHDTIEEREARYRHKKVVDKRNNKLWKLYAKRNKNIIDKVIIKVIEHKNMNDK